MRVGAPGAEGTLTYLHGDHLGSTSLATDENGVEVPESRTGYYPFGEIRYGGPPTDYRFTGQREEAYIHSPLDLLHRPILVRGHRGVVQPRVAQRRIDVLVAQDRLHREYRRSGVQQQRRAGVA
jgi:hypothetical protein